MVAAYASSGAPDDADDRYLSLIRVLDDGFCVIEVIFDDDMRGVDYRFVEVNPAFVRHTGLADAVGRRVKELVPDLEAHWAETYGQVALSGESVRFEHRADSLGCLYDVVAFRVGPAAARTVGVLFRDIRDRRENEARLQGAIAARTAELEQAHEQLRHAQKMEAVGQLTGGIAHDFNNLLQGITGALELIRRNVRHGRAEGLERLVDSAMTSAQRAAALTHRLLAFSRRQPLDPRAVDANPLIASMEALIGRSLDTRIALTVVSAPDLWPIRCDPNQLESAILNLCINARDAMPDAGRLCIATSNVAIDAGEARRIGGIEPGEYVRIAVEDTGVGMSTDTIAHAFEPFFTTKPIGQGTGLGLSMIYGFVRQSGGQVRIESAIGRGTTVSLYLPRHAGAPDRGVEDDAPATLAPNASAVGTVLVIEDDDVIRALIVETLDDLGYRSWQAADGPSGLALLQSGRQVDLLVTDIGLPGLNGRQVADAARVLRPGLHVLFMTGYAENAMSGSECLEEGMALITKPFTIEAFTQRVHAMFDA